MSKQENTALPASPLKGRLRAAIPVFNFRHFSLFCSEICDRDSEIKKPIQKRRKIWNVSTIDFKEKVLQKAKEREDSWSKQVLRRVCGISCLVAEGALYHELCMSLFYNSKPIKEKRGRPVKKDLETSFAKVCSFLENSDDGQNSLQELM